MIAAVLLLTGSVPSAAVAAADDAALAYTQCLFATTRSAHQAKLTVSAFEQRLANSCIAEQGALERADKRLLSLRGEPNAGAQAQAIAGEVRRQMVADYRRLLELGPQLEGIAQLCRADPARCQ